MDHGEISDENYSYSDDDSDSNNIEINYEEIDHERKESNMINTHPENLVWIKQVFKWMKHNEKDNKKYFVIWDNYNPLSCTFILLKNQVDNIGSFSLTVSNKEPYFPYSPPTIIWIEPQLNFIDSFAVKYIESLREDNWNICQQLDDVVNKIHNYIIELENIKYEYDTILVDYLYQISEISGIYPSTIKSDLPKLGVLYTNTNTNEQKYKGVGYSQGNIEEWDIEKWENKKNDTDIILQQMYNHLINSEITNTDIENIKYSALIPYLDRLIKNTSLQELNKDYDKYLLVYKIGDWIYEKIGFSILHESLKKLSNEIRDIQIHINKSSIDKKEIYKLKDYEIQILEMTEIYDYCEQKTEQTEKQNFNSIMKPLQTNIVEDFKFHSFKKKEFTPLNQNKWFRRLFTEWKDLDKSLPIDEDGSVFIRWGAEGGEAQLFKILIFPSLSTPYGGGAYEFDMYIPPDYPNSHPSMKFLTTGGGTVRFNPNLYNCGKICLSLLGTWSGEKWNPKISNIYQVCVSILGLIFVEDPYFNEPGYQNSQGTEKGNKASINYNDNIRIQNIKYGIINMINNPPEEFKEVIKNYYQFRMKDIKNNISKWIEESNNPRILEKLLDEIK